MRGGGDMFVEDGKEQRKNVYAQRFLIYKRIQDRIFYEFLAQ